MGGNLFVNACDDPIYGLLPNGDINPSETLDDALDSILSCGETAETRETGTVAPAPVETPEARSSEAARDAARLRALSAAHENYLADRIPADTMHPAGAPRDIGFGSVSVDAWEVEGPEYANSQTGDLVFHGTEHETPYRVLRYDGRVFLINDAQNDSTHHVDMITRAAERGRPLTITDRSI